jgi:hypothetical protein
MSIISMLLAAGSSMENTIAHWQKPADHAGHVATLDTGFYVGSGEYSIQYECSCGTNFSLGSADPDLIDTDIWNKNAKK